MEPLRSVANAIPFLHDISSKTKINPEYILIALCLCFLLLIQRTIAGPIVSNIFTFYFPVRDSILIVRSPTPKLNEMKKLVVLLVVICMFSMLESCGIRKILPLYFFLKITAIFWIFASEDNSNVFIDVVLNKIPHNWLELGTGLQSAVKDATQTIKSKIEKGGSIDIDDGSINVKEG